MADKKISALTGAATPLGGTEVLPIVQSGATVKVAVSNLTAGRAVSSASYTPTGSSVPTNGLYSPGTNQVAIANNGLQTVLFNGSNNVQIGSSTSATAKMFVYADNSVGDAAPNAGLYVRQDGTNHIQTWAGPGGNIRGWMASDGTFVLEDNNLVVGTAGKGIDFSANTHAAGMTSELLDWYEEGTWTPVISDGTNDATMSANAQGLYTRIGRQVTLIGQIETTSLGSVTGNLRIKGLPFTCGVGTANYSSGTLGYAELLNITAGQSVGWSINSGNAYINLTLWDSAAGITPLQDTEWSSDGTASIQATYFV